jgi:hypothetical protein
VPDLVLDPSRSRVRIQTFAEGLLARLAHDLELLCNDLSGSGARGGAGEGAATNGTASVEAPLRGMVVAGVLGKDGRVDPRGLSASEQRDAITKMQNEVFHAGADAVVRIETHYEAGSARVRLVPPNGKAVETVVRPEVRAEGDTLHAKGAFEISLSSIGSDAVKGPMGAFRVKDRVKVLFDVVFVERA